MTKFEERERAFEAKYAHDEEFRFRVTARRDKLFARWAAEQLHLSDQAFAAFTQTVLAIQDGAGHDERLLDLTRRTFAARGVPEPADLATALRRCAEQARAELLEHPLSLLP